MENDINPQSKYVEVRSDPRLGDLLVPAGRVVFSDEPLAGAWLTFIEHDLAVLPVASREGEPVGVLCRDELVSALLNDEPTTPATVLHDLNSRHKVRPRHSPCPRVHEVMRPAAAVLSIDQSVERAAQLVSGAFGEFVIAVDEDGTIVGLVSTTALHWHGQRATTESGYPSWPFTPADAETARRA